MSLIDDIIGDGPPSGIPPDKEKAIILRILEGQRLLQVKECGECTLCCKLTPVEEINKPKNTWCRFSRSHKGCSLHPNHPISCQAWACAWLQTQGMPNNMRPDRCHCVIDTIEETLTMRHDATGEIFQKNALQIWVDQKFPNAWRDEPIKSFIMHALRNDVPIIIRTGKSVDDFAILYDRETDSMVIKKAISDEDDELYKVRMKRIDNYSKKFQEIHPTPMHQEEAPES